MRISTVSLVLFEQCISKSHQFIRSVMLLLVMCDTFSVFKAALLTFAKQPSHWVKNILLFFPVILS